MAKSNGRGADSLDSSRPDIEETYKAEQAEKIDALPIFIALARLMDQDNP